MEISTSGKETKKHFIVFITAPGKIIYNFKKGYKIGSPAEVGEMRACKISDCSFDLVGQNHSRKVIQSWKRVN
jgi:hypothetical protein